MRAASSLLLSILICMTAAAQETPPSSSLRFVNATGLDGRVAFFINDEALSARGYATGQATGAIPFPAKVHTLRAVHDTLGELRFSIDLKPGEHKTIIALPEVEKPKDGKPAEVKLGQFTLDSPAATRAGAATLTLLQMTNQDTLSINVAGRLQALSRSKPEALTVTQTMGEFPSLFLGNEKLCTLNYREPVDMAVVIFNDAGGRVKTAVFANDAR